MWRWIELTLVILIIVLGMTTLKKVYTTGKERKKVWHLFNKAADELGLEVKDGPVTDYGYPKLHGVYRGREIYVHISKIKGLFNTVYAVENNMPLESDIVITSPETVSLKDKLFPLKVPQLKKEGLDAWSRDRLDIDMVEEMFTSDNVKKLKGLVWKQAGSFRAFIVEPGICMFSTFKAPDSFEEIKETLSACVDLVEDIEPGTSTENINSPRFEKISNRSIGLIIEVGSMIFFFFTGIFLLMISPWMFSWVFINLAAIVMLLSITRMIIIFRSRSWGLFS